MITTKAVLVLNGPSYGTALGAIGPKVTNHKLFLRAPKDFRLVLFTGGEDVSPHLYGHTSPKGMCQSNSERDAIEEEVFKLALKHNIAMAGICRGLQFINVMAGGTLIHHLNGHGSDVHQMECQEGGKVFNVNSLHHQMVVPPKNAYIIGWSPIKRATKYCGDKDEVVNWPGPEVEAVIYPEIKAFGVQYHPEMMIVNSDGYKFFFNMVYDIIYKNIELFTSIHAGRIYANYA